MVYLCINVPLTPNFLGSNGYIVWKKNWQLLLNILFLTQTAREFPAYFLYFQINERIVTRVQDYKKKGKLTDKAAGPKEKSKSGVTENCPVAE